ncbi:type I pullulanase [Prevotella nigrescens]|uniref:type I pullulanase n=1 Tax=Prevotella nigrescens TaxID=28133 RepID=UPI0002184147|nr:type I pullulanase [Prevotella nigrescens]EGQ12322.1 pullulanase [Prevotella nigrescens ATCC 33563]UAK28855.1 type I pullulanase [Prevotella nigrescens]WMS22023.1 type I pullulanase [Prevotella nigrescens]SUB93598.1 Pullulanase precursor [Prevotella nigrescens]
MKLKYGIITLMATFLFTLTAQAQNVFNEVSYSLRQTTFKLNAPKKPTLRIYEAGRGGNAIKKIKMKQTAENVWEATVSGDLKGKFYTFDIGRGETPGVFAKAVGINGHRGAIIDMQTTNPSGWNSDHRLALKSPADLIIYEMHHRDFSIDPSSGLVNKGKFLALTEQKAIRHLEELGINAVHILPSFDFASIDEANTTTPQYNWGYDPQNYNVPEGSYSFDAEQPTRRILEFKQMVQALHKAGIRVILDVVYNHTFDIKGGNFDRTFPMAYYRYTADGKPSNGSGCGNETASEKPLMRQFMLESMKYWADEYHIDGFRVDLMGIHDIETMNLIRKELSSIDPNIFIYGEGWTAGTCAYPTEKLALKAHIKQMPGIAAFSDEIRDALRGPFSDDKQASFLGGIAGFEESIKAGIAGMIAHPQVDYTKVNYTKEPWANEPTQMIAYVSCHDDMCLVDRLKASIPEAAYDMEEVIRLDQLAQTVVFTSQGIPFMLSGEEMLRDKKGVHNSFNSPDEINHLDWNNLKKYPQVFAYYKGLIQMRKSHPAFRLGSAELVRKHLEFLPTQQDCLVAFRLKNHAGGDKWNNIYVVLNGNADLQSVNIPKGKYTIVANNGVINEAGIGEMEGGEVMIDAQTALILHD